jgi:hypothetical protein
MDDGRWSMDKLEAMKAGNTTTDPLKKSSEGRAEA